MGSRSPSWVHNTQFNKQQAMKELKITVDQLKNYLGTGLRCYGMGVMVEGTEYDEQPTPKEFILTGLFHDSNNELWAEVSDKDGDRDEIYFDGDLLPIVYRLSDLDKEIEHNGERFVPIEKLPYGNRLNFYNPINPGSDLEITIETEDYSQEIDLHDGFKIMLLLFEWHFWPFGDEYFEQGLVIDKLKTL